MDEQAMNDPMQGAAMGSAGGPWGAAAGAGLGLVKYFAFDKPANERKRLLAAQTQKFSPWTGLNATAPDEINPMSGAMQGGAAGAALGQNMQNAQNNQNLQQAQINYLNRQAGAPGTQTSVMGPSGMGGADPMAMGDSPWSQYRMQQYGY